MKIVVVAACIASMVVVVVWRRRRCCVNKKKWTPLEYSCLFGIVGGLGPRATSTFVEDLIKQRIVLFQEMQSATSAEQRLARVLSIPSSSPNWTLEQVNTVFSQTATGQLNDQDHVPVLVAQATTVPSRPKFILKHPNTVDPLPQLANVAQTLVDAGATHLAIVCNTAHYFWPQMRSMLDAKHEFIDMIQLTLDYVDKKFPQCTRIGLLATLGTLQCKLIPGYSSRFEFFSPLDISLENQQCVEECIFGNKGIKTGFDRPDTPEGKRNLVRLLEQCVNMKRAFDIQVVILFCSELPLVLFPSSLCTVLDDDATLAQGLDGVLAFLDPSMILVHEVLRVALLSRN